MLCGFERPSAFLTHANSNLLYAHLYKKFKRDSVWRSTLPHDVDCWRAIYQALYTKYTYTDPWSFKQVQCLSKEWKNSREGIIEELKKFIDRDYSHLPNNVFDDEMTFLKYFTTNHGITCQETYELLKKFPHDLERCRELVSKDKNLYDFYTTGKDERKSVIEEITNLTNLHFEKEPDCSIFKSECEFEKGLKDSVFIEDKLYDNTFVLGLMKGIFTIDCIAIIIIRTIF